MITNFSGKLKPQAQEDITKAEWKGPTKMAKAIENSYGNIKYLLDQLNIS